MKLNSFRFFFSLGYKNILRNRTRSFFLCFSVAASVTVAVLLLSFYEGMVTMMRDAAVLNNLGHYQIRELNFAHKKDPNTPVPVNVELREKLLKLNAVEGLSEELILPSFVTSSEGSQAINLMGIQHDQINTVIPLEKSMIEGDASGVVIGAALAEKLNLRLHENLMINYQDVKAELRTEILPITGIYKFSSKRFQRTHVYTKLEAVENLMGVRGIHRYVLRGQKLDDSMLKPLIPPNMLLTHWGELNQEIFFSINFQTGLIYFFLIVLSIGISMTILTPIAMVLNERHAEFKMISHLGTTNTRMLQLIIIEALVMSIGAFIFALVMATAGFYFLKYTGINLVAARGGADIERGGILLPNIVYPVLQIKQITISVLFIAFTVLSSYYMASFKLFKRVKAG